MKVIHICPRFFPAISGAEFYMQRISEELQKLRQVDVTLHCSNAIDFAGLRTKTKRNLPQETFKWHNLFTVYRHEIFQIDYNNALKWYLDKFPFVFSDLGQEELTPFFENGPSIPTLFTQLGETNFDLIHTTFLPYQTILDGYIVSKTRDIPSVCTPFFHFANPRYQKPTGVSLLKYYSKIFACTEAEKKELCKYGIDQKKIEIIPMGVDYEKFESAPKENFLNFYDINEDRPIVLFCGYKNFEKGALTLLQTLPIVQEKISDVLFCFIGPSTKAFNYELSLVKKRGLQKNILNMDPSNLSGYFDKKKLGAFRSCSVYVMPSRSDAYGISFLEAWAAGKPVIGADIGATPEVISNNIDGYLVKFDNTLELAEKIKFLLEKPEEAERLGKNGQKKTRENNSWKNLTKRIQQIYEALVNEEDC